MYSHRQCHALIAKYRLEGNIPALIAIGKEYPKLESLIGDIVVAYMVKVDKVNKRLQAVDLADRSIK